MHLWTMRWHPLKAPKSSACVGIKFIKFDAVQTLKYVNYDHPGERSPEKDCLR